LQFVISAVMLSGMSDRLRQLLHLAHELGREEPRLAILGEGNVSCRIDGSTFLVKASGASLGKLAAAGVARCWFAPVLGLLERGCASDEEVTRVLWESRVADDQRNSGPEAVGPPPPTTGSTGKPSTEAVFHAWLLTLPGVSFVAHTHPESVNGILCSPRARDFADKRLFPDQIVCCGAEAVFVEYVDPGVPLARRIREEVAAFQSCRGGVPRIILLQNHGLIALGATPAGALAATYMCDKAARIFTSAASLGGPVFMPEEEVARIDAREDERYRQRALGME
jgi:rhamnose utilization protein RhaD (predicted bifunctional aldolase and dehydrogenase)